VASRSLQTISVLPNSSLFRRLIPLRIGITGRDFIINKIFAL
jgi:hypothetical protein